MNEDMNRFDFNTEGKICDYGCEEPKVLTDQEILEELNFLQMANDFFREENQMANYRNECLQEEVDLLEKALELACQYVEYDFDGYSGVGYRIHYFKTKAKEMMKSE